MNQLKTVMMTYEKRDGDVAAQKCTVTPRDHESRIRSCDVARFHMMGGAAAGEHKSGAAIEVGLLWRQREGSNKSAVCFSFILILSPSLSCIKAFMFRDRT